MLLIVAVGLLLGADAPKNDAGTKDVEKAIRALNKAFEKQDVEAVKALTTDDHLSITSYAGAQNKAEQLKDLPELKITEYKEADIHVKLIAKDVALIRYQLQQKGTYRGKTLPLKSYATAIWVHRGGKWLEANYQETTMDGK
jgi:ketosteroid isomerase-like protein